MGTEIVTTIEQGNVWKNMLIGLFSCPEFYCQIELDLARVYAAGRDDKIS